jgi:hypothetical protein
MALAFTSLPASAGLPVLAAAESIAAFFISGRGASRTGFTKNKIPLSNAR